MIKDNINTDIVDDIHNVFYKPSIESSYYRRYPKRLKLIKRDRTPLNNVFANSNTSLIDFKTHKNIQTMYEFTIMWNANTSKFIYSLVYVNQPNSTLNGERFYYTEDKDIKEIIDIYFFYDKTIQKLYGINENPIYQKLKLLYCIL